MMSKCGLLDLPEFTLVSGVGNYSEHKACVMSAAVACYRMSRGEPIGKATDDMECCCSVLRAFLIRLNDSNLWRGDSHRTEVLMPFVSRLAGTKNTELMMKRVFVLVDWSVRTIAADAMERARFDGHEVHAGKLRAVEIVDAATADAAIHAAADAAIYAASHAANAASAAANAAADAAKAASKAASAATVSAADAAIYAASHASDAAIYAAANARDTIISQCVHIIERMISMSEEI
jgi:hypothetical protein